MILKKPATLLLLLSFCFVFQSRAQYTELGLMIGGSNYKGELSEHTFNTDFLHLAGGGFIRHNWNRHWSYRINLYFGKISGDDALGSTYFQNFRNLSFESGIQELSGLIEFNFFPYEIGKREYRFTPYIHSGLTLFHFNPKAQFGDDLVELQPLGTEGQFINNDKSYKRFQIALPIGGGIKFNLGRQFGIAIEVSARRAYTDYLDDVSTTYPDKIRLGAASGPLAVAMSDRSIIPVDSLINYPSITGRQRGNSENNDWYIFGGITLNIRLSSVLADVCKPFKRRRYS